MKNLNVQDIYLKGESVYHKDGRKAVLSMCGGVAKLAIASSDTYTHEVEIEISQERIEKMIKQILLDSLWRKGDR